MKINKLSEIIRSIVSNVKTKLEKFLSRSGYGFGYAEASVNGTTLFIHGRRIPVLLHPDGKSFVRSEKTKDVECVYCDGIEYSAKDVSRDGVVGKMMGMVDSAILSDETFFDRETFDQLARKAKIEKLEHRSINPEVYYNSAMGTYIYKELYWLAIRIGCDLNFTKSEVIEYCDELLDAINQKADGGYLQFIDGDVWFIPSTMAWDDEKGEFFSTVDM